MKILFVVLISFALLGITGCATIMTGNKQQILISSHPTQAKVTIYNQSNNRLVQTVQTPANVKLSKTGFGMTGRYRFEIEKEGYKDDMQVVSKKMWPPNTWYWGNILLLGLPCLVDVIGGAAYDYPESVYFSLEQSRESRNTPQSPVAQRQIYGAEVEIALAKAAQEVLEKVPKRSKLAIVYVTAPDKPIADYIAGQLEYIWFNEGYVITDRSELDRVRQEQKLQISGEVEESTAVSIGKLAGADIIVTGRVDGEGNLRRLRLRALDTQTAQVIGVASIKL